MTSAAALIPAYQPTAVLGQLIQELPPDAWSRVIVVDDGSRPECRPIFRAISERPGVITLEHARNQGKGAALKTGLAFLAANPPPGEVGCVTLDADGQHRPQDALRIARELSQHPSALVLGVRDFSRPDVPWRSRVGNLLTRLIFWLLAGPYLRDTQTGLRGIPHSFAPRLLDLPSSGYEYELEVLLACRQDPIRQVVIETVYLDGNRSSHFDPIRDSLRIYAALVRWRWRTLRAKLPPRA